jgi:diaminopimelate decarboxylase
MVDFTNFKTPFYLYDVDLLGKTVSIARTEAERHGFLIHYAIKANNNPVIAGIIRDKGLGVDCVSGNEILKSIELGFSREGIVFAGVGKTDREIHIALDRNILINCESAEELRVIEEIAMNSGRIARVALRVNPSVEAHTHHYISTGMEENKFGISLEYLTASLDICESSAYLDFAGLHFHIGSQITSLEPYRQLCRRVNQIWKEYSIADYGGYILNMGGGLGIDYNDPEGNSIPDFASFFKVFSDTLKLPAGIEIHFELGRSLTGQSGKIVTRVLYTKQGAGKKFVITDAGMTELMRPSLYQAVHKITNISSSGNPGTYDIVGPVCESSDIFAKNAVLPATKRGDLLQIFSCGAYAESMTLDFNLRDKAGSVYMSGGEILRTGDYRNVHKAHSACK